MVYSYNIILFKYKRNKIHATEQINFENNEKGVSRPGVPVPGTTYSIIKFSFIKYIHKILSIIISQVPG